MDYDIFISYARRDNQQGRVTELKQQLEADYRAFTNTELRCFFDLEDIKGMDDWRHRLLEGLRQSQLLLLVLSPGYLDSEYCEWEIVEYLKYEHSRAAQGQGVAPIYFVEIPGLDTPDFMQQAAAWVANIRRRHHFDLRPWFDDGVSALNRQEVRRRLDDLNRALQDRLSRLRRLAAGPGQPARPQPPLRRPSHRDGPPAPVRRAGPIRRPHRPPGHGRFGQDRPGHPVRLLPTPTSTPAAAGSSAAPGPPAWPRSCGAWIRTWASPSPRTNKKTTAAPPYVFWPNWKAGPSGGPRPGPGNQTRPRPRPCCSWITWNPRTCSSRPRPISSPANAGSGSWPPPGSGRTISAASPWPRGC